MPAIVIHAKVVFLGSFGIIGRPLSVLDIVAGMARSYTPFQPSKVWERIRSEVRLRRGYFHLLTGPPLWKSWFMDNFPYFRTNRGHIDPVSSLVYPAIFGWNYMEIVGNRDGDEIMRLSYPIVLLPSHPKSVRLPVIMLA